MVKVFFLPKSLAKMGEQKNGSSITKCCNGHHFNRPVRMIDGPLARNGWTGYSRASGARSQLLVHLLSPPGSAGRSFVIWNGGPVGAHRRSRPMGLLPTRDFHLGHSFLTFVSAQARR
jgi:hypothetical protein